MIVGLGFGLSRASLATDPLSCPLFDIAIEPLACHIRTDQNIKGYTIPGLEDPIKIKLFADDTNLFLSKDDRIDHIQETLNNWCETSGARFNIEKTEIIPLGKNTHRRTVIDSRKINPEDERPLPDRIRIARDGDAVRILGAWIGNNIDDITPWEPILDKIRKKLKLWERAHLTLNGKRLLIQAIIGGHTQFLTKAQGMPERIEKILTKIISNFIWGEDKAPRIAEETLQRPIEEGGQSILDIKSRNEAIEIIWLKAYLNFSPSRPQWATVTDHVVLATAPAKSVKDAIMNPFLQTWEIPSRGERTINLREEVKRMFSVARKYKIRLAAIKISPRVLAQLPAWYHISAERKSLNNAKARCLLRKHETTTVADLVKISARNRHPQQYPDHQQNQNCICQECTTDKNQGCKNPNKCVEEALTRLNLIPAKHNPTRQEPPDGLSLTKSGKQRNHTAKQNNDAITFDATITCKENLAECFRIFTDPTRLNNQLTQRYKHQGPIPRCREITVYTDGACMNNGKANARCGSGIWFDHNSPRNLALRVPGDDQSNQVGELVAVIAAISAVPPYQPLKIITDSKYVIEGLTTHLEDWENNGWIEIKNANLFKKAAHLLRLRTARTSFQWVKGHNGDNGNEESDALAKKGATKQNPDLIDLEIPIEFDIQGAKLTTLTQAKAYRGILRKKKHEPRNTTEKNLKLTREAITKITKEVETNATIWRSTRKKVIRPIVQQFLYKSIHGIFMVGKYWRNIENCEEREICRICNTTDSMEHILTQCEDRNSQEIWSLARDLWPHNNIPWPEITLGTILGCGCLNLQSERPMRNDNQQRTQKTTLQGPTRLMQILISESAYLIWLMRGERAIQGTMHTLEETKSRWLRTINERLTNDKITATKIQRNDGFTTMVVNTWEQALNKNEELPPNWINRSEVLVGRTA